MSMHDARSRANGGRWRRFLVSPMNAAFALLFFAAGVAFWFFDTWLTGLVFVVAGVAQYVFALFARRRPSGSDVWRMSFFEPTDERDRAVLKSASAFVAYVAGAGSMVAFMVVLLAFPSQTVLVVYLALQTIAINLLWGISIWTFARRS